MSRYFCLLIITTLLFTNCIQEPVAVSDDSSSQQKEQGQMLFKMDMTAAPAAVTNLRGILSRDNFDSVFFDFEIKDGYATALIEDLVAGLWQLQVDAFNLDGVIIYSGNTLVQVVPGAVTPVNLYLNPTTGGLDIIVTWGGNYFLDSLLVAYYPFENSLDDLSKYQNHGMDRGGVFYTEGVHGLAVQFDGIDDFVEISDGDQYDIEDKTITFWFYKANDFIQDTPGQNDVEGLVFKAWDTGLQRDFSFSIQNQQAPFTFNSFIWDGSDSLTTLSVENLVQAQTWYFVALVMGKGETNLYLDGKLALTATYDGLLYLNDAPIVLGKSTYNSEITRYFNGKIDDFAIFKKKLSAQEVSHLAGIYN